MKLTRRQLRRIIIEAVFKEETKEALMNMIDMSWENFWKDDADKRKTWWNSQASSGEKIAIINALVRDAEQYWNDIKGEAKGVMMSDWLLKLPLVMTDMISTGAAAAIMSRHMEGTPGEWDVAEGLKELLSKLFDRTRYA